MFRCNWKNLGPVKFISNLLGRKSKNSVTVDSPWQGDLEHLAERYNDPMRPTTYSAKSDEAAEAEAMLKKLCDDVQADGHPESDRIVVRKERRQQDTTSVDMKAWWGQAVATWDPINAKNVDSIDQQRRPRKSKWFDN